MLGKALEESWHRRHRDLHECRLAACSHRGHQTVDGWLSVVLDTIERLHPLDELGVLLQAQRISPMFMEILSALASLLPFPVPFRPGRAAPPAPAAN